VASATIAEIVGIKKFLMYPTANIKNHDTYMEKPKVVERI
jgi:hypothetical protein